MPMGSTTGQGGTALIERTKKRENVTVDVREYMKKR